MVNFLKIFEKFFLHRLSGVRELRQRVRPDGAAPFSAPAERGTRTASAGSPCPGGTFFSAPAERGARTAAGVFVPDGREVFAELQRGERAAPRGGARG